MEPEHDQDVSFEPRISEDLRTSRRPQSQHRTFRKGVRFPVYRVVLICLGFLDTALLVTALVFGMYCAKAKDFTVSDLTFAPLIIERDFLRNHSDLFKERQTVQVELENQRRAHIQLQVQIKQLQTITDSLQSHIQVLRAEKSQLEARRSALAEVSCEKCPNGWIFHKTSCYFYSNDPSKKNWADSRADCISRGGDLLVINNFEEQKAINNFYPKTVGTGVQWKMGFWIGLTDNVTTGVWTWVNNAIENNTAYWQTGQPDNEESLAGHCAAFSRNILSWRSWYNRNCENDVLNWICEMEPQ